MSDPYIGEIRMFAGSFAPVDWAFCDGQLLSIAENSTLFNLIGTTYGGDGQQTFALPDLRGRMPMHQGSLPGQGQYPIGQAAGTELVTLTTSQLPTHTHVVAAAGADGTTGSPAGAVPAHVPGGTTRYTTGGSPTPMAAGLVSATGGSEPHENMSPFLGVNFIISLYGIYPTQQ